MDCHESANANFLNDNDMVGEFVILRLIFGKVKQSKICKSAPNRHTERSIYE